VCGSQADASLRLLAAGGPEAAAGATTDEPLRIAALSGGWSDVGSFGAEIRGLEQAPSRGRVYGVTAADELVTVDPDTGQRLATIGSLPATAAFQLPTSGEQPALYESLAFDPGATASPGDDLLYAIRLAQACPDDEFCDAELVTIDPDDATTLARGPITELYPGTRHGLAFDSARGVLYSTKGFSGLWEIDPACVGTPGCFGCCEATDTELDLVRTDASLAYEVSTDRLFLVGTDSFGGVLLDVIDAATLAPMDSLGIDAFTPGALAAPEPAAGTLGGAALVTLAISAASRRSLRRPRPAARRSC
jgi:hypothetical protein